MTETAPLHSLGMNVSGTLTDFTLFDESSNEIAVLNRLTPLIAVIEGTAALLRHAGDGAV